MRRVVAHVLAFVFFSIPIFAQDLASFEKRVTVKKLANGLTLIVMERHEAPVFSAYTFVDAGSVQDPKGDTGLAHMFEHMAFKGTTTIGTTNWPAEKAALAKVEAAYKAYSDARDQLVKVDQKHVQQLEQAWQDAIKAADKYVVRNAYPRIIEENGGEGMNAQTDYDETTYFYSFPSNRLELYCYLESSRFIDPVMREFYKERDVVYEERRMRTDSNPIGRLLEQFTAAAFNAHPYHRPTVGWPSDLRHFSATDAQAFFHRYYVPSNIYVAIVGDVNTSEVLALATKYFGRIPAGPKPDENPTVEPPQTSEREVRLTEQSQPIYLEGFHRPSYQSPDDAVYDAITDIMSNGRVSRMYRSLVRDQKIAADAAGFTGMPGTKYPQLFAFYAIPSPGHTPAEMQTAIRKEIDKLRNTYVTDQELEMFKTRARADLLRGLADNAGLAAQLAVYQARFGDWRELFRQLDRYDKVTKEDIKRVADETFKPENRTVGIIESTQMAGAQQTKGGAQQ